PFPARLSDGGFFSVVRVEGGAAVAVASSLAGSAAASREGTGPACFDAGGCSGESAFDVLGEADAVAGSVVAAAFGACDAACEFPEVICELRHAIYASAKITVARAIPTYTR